VLPDFVVMLILTVINSTITRDKLACRVCCGSLSSRAIQNGIYHLLVVSIFKKVKRAYKLRSPNICQHWGGLYCTQADKHNIELEASYKTGHTGLSNW